MPVSPRRGPLACSRHWLTALSQGSWEGLVRPPLLGILHIRSHCFPYSCPEPVPMAWDPWRLGPQRAHGSQDTPPTSTRAQPGHSSASSDLRLHSNLSWGLLHSGQCRVRSPRWRKATSLTAVTAQARRCQDDPRVQHSAAYRPAPSLLGPCPLMQQLPPPLPRPLAPCPLKNLPHTGPGQPPMGQ